MMPMTRVQKSLLGIGIAVAALPLLFWGLVTLILPGVIHDQARRFGEKIGYVIEIGEIDLSPLLLRARLRDLRLAPALVNANSDALLTLKQLEVDARFWPLLTGTLSLERIALDTPEVWLTRAGSKGNKGNDWNWLTLIKRVNQLSANDTPEDSAQHGPLKVTIDALLIDDARLSVRDGQNKSAYDLGPFSLHLTELRNQDDTGHVGGSSLQSKYTLNLGQVIIPMPAQDGLPSRQLRFAHVTATGEVMENSASMLHAALSLALDDGVIQSDWQLAADGSLTGKLQAQGLAVAPWLNLLPSYQPLESPSGVINGHIELQQDAQALMLDGDLKIDQLDIRVRGTSEPLLAWNSTALSQLHLVLPRVESKPGQLMINEILVDNPKLRFVINTQRQSNFRALFNRPEPMTGMLPGESGGMQSGTVNTAATTAAKPDVPHAAPGFRYDIRNVRLKNGAMFFGDESINPVFHVDVTDLNGSVQGISNEPGRYATLALTGRAAKTGSLRARGRLAFADPRLNHDVLLVFKNIPLNATNPYAMTFAGYRIDDGRIDVDLRYTTKDGQLEGKNRFVIRKIKLGGEVPDYQGTRLPLGLAIALLEDSDGMIDVNIPVKGNVNEPEFSVGHLVWQAVKTVLANVVTAPFRALGALLGIDNLDAIAFVPGESALPIESEEQLAKVGELLAKRPKSKLVIHGTVDPAVDASALARAMADTAILQASGIKVAEGEPLPLPNLSDPKVKAGLKSAYGAQVGRIKLGQRLLTLPDNAERDAQLRQELIQSYAISDAQLKQLAAQRAEAVKARLLAIDPRLVDRVSIGDTETVSASDAGIPLRVSLETGA